MEYVKSAGATNDLGPTDTAFREGLGYYWDQYYSSAIPKFEEVKRLFPQHSEVDRLIQSSQQLKAEGKEKSSFPVWIIVAVVVVVLLLLLLLIIIIAGVVVARRRKKRKKEGPASGPASDGGRPRHTPAPAPAPAAARAHSPSPPAPAPMPHIMAGDQGKTIDLSRTMALTADDNVFPNYGSIQFVSGPLSGQRFEIKADGDYIGRDGGSAQIVIGDPRISKRHVWIGVKNGRVVIADQNSRNGTFVNDPRSARVNETSLSPGDTVILGESDVARFEYQSA
jgi:hypothetical protein